MSDSRLRWFSALLGLAVAAAACGTPVDGAGGPDQQAGVEQTVDDTSGSVGSAAPSTTSGASSTSTVPPIVTPFSLIGQAESVLDRVIDGVGSLAEGAVTSVDGGRITIVVDRVLVDNGGVEDQYEVEVALGGVSVGDRAVVTMVVDPPTGEFVLISLGVWDAASGEVRPRTDPEEAIAILGDPEVLSRLWDAPYPRLRCGIPGDDRPYNDLLEVISGYVDGTSPRQAFAAAEAVFPSDGDVERIADSADREEAGFIDGISGGPTPVDDNDVFYQLSDGTAEADMSFRSTVPVIFDVSGLDGGINVALLDLEAGRFLGHSPLHPNDDSGVAGLAVAYSGQPEVGNDVTIVTFDFSVLVGCGNPSLIYDRLVEPGMSATLASVPYDDFAGTARLQIDVASGETRAVGRDAFDLALGRP